MLLLANGGATIASRDLKVQWRRAFAAGKTFIFYYLQPEYETIDDSFGEKTARPTRQNKRDGGRRRDPKNYALENGSDLRCFPSRDGLQTHI